MRTRPLLIAVLFVGGAAGTASAASIEWIHDDYATAREAARSSARPLVIDMWAPWCHTCLSMKHTVLERPEIVAAAADFVWLAVDTDRPQNAAVVEKYEIGAWPTFYVVDASKETVTARLVGAATVEQFASFLDAGRAKSGGAKYERAALDGDRAAAAGNWPAAAKAYAAAVEGAPATWARRPMVLVAHVGALYQQHEWSKCAALGHRNLAAAAAGASASAADLAYYTQVCAERAGDAEQARAIRADILRADQGVRKVLADPAAGLSADDRSDALRILREAATAQGDGALARRFAEQQRDVLDAAARAAKDPHERMTWNWPRAEVYVHLGQAEKLLADLERSVADLPEAYDPPYRLAWVLLQLERADEALPHAKTALARVYGPRKARVQALIADIHHTRGDRAGEREMREAVVATLGALPDGQRRPAALEAAQKQLAALGAAD